MNPTLITSTRGRLAIRAIAAIYIGVLVAGMSDLASAREALPAPVHFPVSWQTSTNSALARPAPPGGLTVVGRPGVSERSELAGEWKREKEAGGELRSFVLEPEGVLTAVFAGVKTNLTVKGKWELKEQAVHFQVASKTEKASIPALRETKLFVVREAAGIILVGEKDGRFTRPK
jgi:hypothetical protein